MKAKMDTVFLEENMNATIKVLKDTDAELEELKDVISTLHPDFFTTQGVQLDNAQSNIDEAIDMLKNFTEKAYHNKFVNDKPFIKIGF